VEQQEKKVHTQKDDSFLGRMAIARIGRITDEDRARSSLVIFVVSCVFQLNRVTLYSILLRAKKDRMRRASKANDSIPPLSDHNSKRGQTAGPRVV